MSHIICRECKGSRLCKEASAVRFHGLNINRLCSMNIANLYKWFQKISPNAREKKIVGQVLKELLARLGFLNDVGVTYLSLERSASTLSGGEAQRIRLATQIGSALTGVLYVLDEPSIGLHKGTTILC